jgi:hypothetical protein
MLNLSRNMTFALVAVCIGGSACGGRRGAGTMPDGGAGEDCFNPAECGIIGPLIAMPVPAIHSGLMWSENSWELPKLLFWSRHANMRGTDVADYQCLEELILGAYSSWPISSIEWMQSFSEPRIDGSDPFKDTDPGAIFPGYTFNQCLRSSFKHLVAGGYRLRQGLTQSVPQRIVTYLERELVQIWSIGHADAFANGGKFYTTYLAEQDALDNLGSFADAGHSRNLLYDIDGTGHSSLADGRVATFGGHNMNSHNGYRKVNVYDPDVEQWEARPESCLRKNWRNDRYGRNLGYLEEWESLINPPAEAPMWATCDPRLRDDSDPPALSDMRYARWSPTSIVMPNGMVLILSGTDQDDAVGPDPVVDDKDQRDAAFRATRIFHAVPEVFDPVSGKTAALENARRRFPLYPQATVVQTGPGADDWQVCVLGGFAAPAEEASPMRGSDTNPAAEWLSYCDDPGCEADDRAIRYPGPYTAASVDCLDVQAALADADRNIPAEKHWTHVTTASDAHDECCAMADLVEIDADGKIARHEWIVFGGKRPVELPTATPKVTPAVAGLDWAQPNPQWQTMAELAQPSNGANAIVLPTGEVLIVGGRVGAHREDETGDEEGALAERWNLSYQIFDPATDEVRTVARTRVPRGLHGTAVLLPDATVAVMGYDRHNLVQRGSEAFPPGDADLGVSNAEVYHPPYLFDPDGNPATRPEILAGPDSLDYGDDFVIGIGTDQHIDSVVLIRTDFVTHTLNTGNRYVKLAHEQADASLSVRAPQTAVQALPGDYMLFIVDDHGVPSRAKHVRVGPG